MSIFSAQLSWSSFASKKLTRTERIALMQSLVVSKKKCVKEFFSKTKVVSFCGYRAQGQFKQLEYRPY